MPAAQLACLSAEELGAFLREVPLQPTTSRTIVDPDHLLAELRQIRERRRATSIEVIEGNIGLAAPILDPRRRPLGCIGMGGPEFRLRHRHLDEMGRRLAEAAKHVSDTLAAGSR